MVQCVSMPICGHFRHAAGHGRVKIFQLTTARNGNKPQLPGAVMQPHGPPPLGVGSHGEGWGAAVGFMGSWSLGQHLGQHVWGAEI